MRRAVQLHRLACGLFVAAAACAVLVAASPPGTRGARYIALHLVLTALMLVAWATARTAGAWRTTLVAGVLARLVLLPVPSFTSTDAVRYLFDGAVTVAGLDPYRLAPDAPLLTGLRASWPLPDVQLGVTTVYPPGAVGLFALAAAAGPTVGPWVWKAMVTLASLGVLALAARGLRAAGRGRHLALVALSPLLVLEGGIGAHVDLFAALAVAVALVLAAGRSELGAGVALGVGTLVKLLPALAIVPLAAAARRPIRVVAGALATIATGYGVALAIGLQPVGSLSTFFAESRFGSPLGMVLAGSVLPPLLLVGALFRAGRLATAGSPAHGVQLALAAPLAVGPVAFPWYLASLVPALALAPSAVVVAWLAAAPLTYEVIDREALRGEWTPAAWPLWAIAAAWVIGIVVDRRRRASPPLAPAAAGSISGVVPVLDEERRIGQRLAELAATPGLHEVIVVDGGSADRTAEVARRAPGVRVLEAPCGRAAQMNAGARVATGDVLLFLHADVSLPPDAAAWVGRALGDPSTVAGAFRIWTVVDAGSTWLGPLIHLADLRSRYTRLPYGDQAVFVRRSAFERVGGFPDQPLMEDLEIGRRLWRLGRIVTVPAVVRVSGRRFVARPLWYTVLVNVFPLLYRLGVPPRILAQLYGNPR